MADRVRVGIDLGGTKIEGIALDDGGRERARHRIAAPRGDYDRTLDAIADVVAALAVAGGFDPPRDATIGIGMPGSISPATGRVQNANSTWLNGQPFGRDLEARVGQPIRVANDANCFAVSEATDGGGAGAASVFGVILGTGCGGGLVIGGRLVDGPRGIGGEWGHNPLPWGSGDEHPGPRCWCGRSGCMETWVSGTGLARDHAAVNGTGRDGHILSAEEIVASAAAGNVAARATLDRHASRLARGLAHVVNIVDPEVIVLGGGLSRLAHLYDELPRLMAPWIFADAPAVKISPPRWGDASGVRGAAWLWN
jgi:fructokinase